MEFGPVPLAQAEGARLAHSLLLEDGGARLRKGRVLTAEDLARMAQAGLAEVVVARLGPADLDEDSAAQRLARALVPDEAAAGLRLSGAFTGRVNLHARAPGLFVPDVAAVNAFNRVDPAITLATLPPHARVARGTLAATVKIIPYGVPARAVDAACAAAAGAVSLQPVVLRRAGLVQSLVPGQPEKLNQKGLRAVRRRLAALGMDLTAHREVPHEVAAIAGALSELEGDVLLVLTGSATSDSCDTAPRALVAAGGRLIRFGMPVDPGNLLFLGELGDCPVIGLPGSARSKVAHGVDWVLERIACGIPVGSDDIALMGVGGLLKEIPTRPQPREQRRG
ncbi:molybdopterin-binding protein [Alkalilacustris brevis]|uniref:molybdopterin-binding protein n=1 Tax=Alkalilacustris brevis TaxID=2026338 RepID=UPI000E0E0895|nr:molybdopterin-binding protein [Alkalilacustris brevis]